MDAVFLPFKSISRQEPAMVIDLLKPAFSVYNISIKRMFILDNKLFFNYMQQAHGVCQLH
jgi:hypothetical protein